MAINEAAFIARVEASSPDEFCRILRKPTGDEERVLRAYFGDDRYQRLHLKAVRNSSSRAVRESKGLVVVIHGIMGSELSEIGGNGKISKIWLNYLGLGLGKFGSLKLNPDGLNGVSDVRATGILKKFYGELIVALSENWDVRPFWFDWRKSLDLAAAELEVKIRSWARPDAPLHIVAHSMGGLVARTFMANYPDRWSAMWDKEGSGKKGGRLIMLGTPNHGSFAIPQLISGIEPLLRKLGLLDLKHDANEIRAVANTFPGSFQMLPSSLFNKEWEAFYKTETWANIGVGVSRRHLEDARLHHEKLQQAIDPKRMIYLAGFGQQTACGISDPQKADQLDAYKFTDLGDGRVPHSLGLLGPDVPTYYIKENHGDLPLNEKVQKAIDQLLEKGTQSVDGVLSPSDFSKYKNTFVPLPETETVSFHNFKRAVTARRGRTVSSEIVSSIESQLLDDLVQEFLGRGSGSNGSSGKSIPPTISTGGELCYQINVKLIWGKIQEIEEANAIAVGHYLGVAPVGAELALDEAISRLLPGTCPTDSSSLPEGDRVITQFTQRRILQGELGELFFLNDPRAADGRLIVLAGMGLPGGFGGPELSVLSEQICWSVGLLGKKHLATVLIGTRSGGGITTDEAVRAFLTGAIRAGIALADDKSPALDTITFVQHDPRRSLEIDQAIPAAQEFLKKRYSGKVKIHYTRLEESERRHLENQGSLPPPRTPLAQRQEGRDREPTRLMVMIEEASQTYRYSALTNEATIPERNIPLDPSLVTEANEALAAAADKEEQNEQGRFLERLLFPNDLRGKIYTDSPLVLTVDPVTARIHWEMLAQTGLPKASPDNQPGQVSGDSTDEFLGTGRGLTRQLRTPYASLPDRMPPQQRVLRVLIVADPAEDAPLPGAEQEGVAVADLFESFNHIHGPNNKNRVEVVRLLGPREATRSNLLKRIMLENFDVLHFAGHCHYNAQQPEKSGWIFSHGKFLTARELNRVDRIPKFVFSNACESGITNDRAELRSVDLAPSFAESFFARGVSNFVCTAWPVDDRAALDFALRLYSELLGIGGVKDEIQSAEGPQAENPKDFNRFSREPKPMYAAMREARREIINKDYGVRTWGAYQHYGNPFMRFFDTRSFPAPNPPGPVAEEAKNEDAVPPQRIRHNVKTAKKSAAAPLKSKRK